jgi:iron complex outermembrane recepter protein
MGNLRSSGVGTAVFFALYGLPYPSMAAQGDMSDEVLQEITVTATRRTQTLESVPYSISVVSADQLTQAGVTDLASLAQAVPGLSDYNYGARLSGATPPIIRGINATSTPRGFRSFEQDPVGTYIGNSPIDGYFQLDDIKQVEVLRGPQGTLYGAGSLGGALRFIPNSPELGMLNGSVEASGSRSSHSTGTGYSVSGLVNLPVGETIAFRASGKYDYEPGWINVFGLIQRTNDSVYGQPVLADPGDIINSPAIYSSRNDWNSQKTSTGRASLLWKPGEAFSAELAAMLSYVNGDGGPTVNPTYAGGAFPIDPRITFPAGSDHQEFSQIDQPWWRHTNLTSLDMSYDVGFATASATSSFYTTSGSTIEDGTYVEAGAADGVLLPYYSGVPQNPRFIYAQQFTDTAHTFTQEIRLISKAAPDNAIDYVVGLFYENQSRTGAWYITTPGSPERSIAQGCTAQYSSLTPDFPNCLQITGPNDLDFAQADKQQFIDKSIFGELTWHVMQHGAITLGARHFWQQFTDAQSYDFWTFPTFLPATQRQSPASKTVGKADISYEYDKNQYVYVLWSQGFRRGGANSVPYSGFFAENPQLRYYTPDTTNNYEAGLKGRLDNGVNYTLAVFDIYWSHPQISATLPSGDLAVYNGNKAQSKGLELESNGPLFGYGFGYNFSFAYTDATLTSDFSLAANNGLGQILPGEITGQSGEQLPGSPKTSVAATLTYDHNLAAGYHLTLAANGTYRTHITFNLAPIGLGNTVGIKQSSSYEIMNLSASINHQRWRYTAYVTNLLDKQNILAPPAIPNLLNNLSNDYVVNPPRQIGVRIAYAF